MTERTQINLILILCLMLMIAIPIFFNSVSLTYFEDNSFRIVITGCLPYGYCS